MSPFLSSFESVFIDNRVDDVVFLDGAYGDDIIDHIGRRKERIELHKKVLYLWP